MFKSIFIDEFYQKEKNQELTIIDVREEDEFAEGHIPNAKNLPLSELAERFSELNSEEEYYIICHSGGRSGTACDFLSSHGLDVTNVMGGMSSWKGPVE